MSSKINMKTESEILSLLRYLQNVYIQSLEKPLSRCEECGEKYETYTSIFKDENDNREVFTHDTASLILDNMSAAGITLEWVLGELHRSTFINISKMNLASDTPEALIAGLEARV
jgi:hypothetical protein